MMSLANTTYSGGIKVDPQKKEIVDYFYGKPSKINFITSIIER